MGLLYRLWRNDEAQDLVEYVLILVLVSTALGASLGLLKSGVSTAFSEAISSITGA